MAALGRLIGGHGFNDPTTVDRLPLNVGAVGSFFVGGHDIEMSEIEAGFHGSGGVTVDQMYVQYMIPAQPEGPPLIMIHGATLSGKTYETTPDDRMGWHEYFVRKGFPSFVVDQVGRGRSGFNHASFNTHRAAAGQPIAQPNLRRFANEVAWPLWRLGPTFGIPFDDSQFPTDAADEFAKQSLPDLAPTPQTNAANHAALAQLTVGLEGAVIISHSQSGRFPLHVTLRDDARVRAVVAIEPVGCTSDEFTQDEICRLAQVPILIVFGDHLDAPQPFGPLWSSYYDDCEALARRVNAAGGKAELVHLPDRGFRGNSHMIMQDRNNLEIADLVIDWLGAGQQVARPLR